MFRLSYLIFGFIFVIELLVYVLFFANRTVEVMNGVHDFPVPSKPSNISRYDGGNVYRYSFGIDQLIDWYERKSLPNIDTGKWDFCQERYGYRSLAELHDIMQTYISKDDKYRIYVTLSGTHWKSRIEIVGGLATARDLELCGDRQSVITFTK